MARKRYRRKRGSCPLCHPEKVGWEPRWSPRDLERLRRWERERHRAAWDSADEEADADRDAPV